MRGLVGLFLLVGLLGGCAIGNKYDYQIARAEVAAPAPAPADLAVAVVDLRPYVLDRDKTPDFVGLQRGGYGNPFDVTTKSGAPLASEFTQLLQRSFARDGVLPPALVLTAGAPAADIQSAFAATKASRLLLVEMREWKSDVFAQVTMHWDLTGRVYDRNGATLGEDRVQGTAGTGQGGLETANSLIAATQAAKRFGELLAKPGLAPALR